jgi:hypothetical protein
MGFNIDDFVKNQVECLWEAINKIIKKNNETMEIVNADPEIGRKLWEGRVENICKKRDDKNKITEEQAGKLLNLISFDDIGVILFSNTIRNGKNAGLIEESDRDKLERIHKGATEDRASGAPVRRADYNEVYKIALNVINKLEGRVDE